MTRIVGVHGIAQQFKGGEILRQVWWPALVSGMENAGHRETARAMTIEDLRVSFFGDLFRKGGSLGGGAQYKAQDVRSNEEVQLLTVLYDAAVEEEPSLGPARGSLGPVKVAVQVMVERLLRSKVFAGLIPEQVFVGNLKQVMRFLTDEVVRDRVLERVDREVTSETRVVIGHSLGSIVAYEYLCRYKPLGVQAFVTVGSPLGIRNVIFERLHPTPESGVGVWPAEDTDSGHLGVSSWTNLADANDIVALQKKLGHLFKGKGVAQAPQDYIVDNGPEPHGISPYLSSPVTGSAIQSALS